MSKRVDLRHYGYVNRPYEAVRTALHEHPLELLQQATNSAAARAGSVATSLRVSIAGFEIGISLRLRIHGVHDDEGVAGLSPVTRVELGWEAASTPALFPLMSAQLSAWPLSPTETQLEIEGAYQPPMGPVGHAIDAAVGHRIAQASVHRFLEDIVEQLRRDLPASA